MSDRGGGIGMQLSKLSCGGLYGELQKYPFCGGDRDVNVNMDDRERGCHEGLQDNRADNT
jgi:hypothetical protein